MNFRQLVRQAERVVVNNSPAILTGLGVAGALTTAYLAGTASFKAAQIIALRQNLNDVSDDGREFTLKENFELVWKLYVPTAGAAIFTISAIIFANRISDRRAAAVAAAWAISEKAMEEYKEKVIEKLGPKKEQTARDELNQERVNKTFSSQNVIIIGKGDVLCCEVFTGRYFMSDMETLRKAMNDVNLQINNDLYASLTDFYDLIGLPTTGISDDIGWNHGDKLELNFSTTLTDDNRPCITFEYSIHPLYKYNRLS